MEPVIVRSLQGARLLLTLSLLTGCGAAPPPPPPAAAPPSLAGTAWRLVKFKAGDDTVLTPDDRTKYTLEFGADGTVTTRIDCNRGRGTWASHGPSQLTLGPFALTRAMCPPGSLHDRIVRDWSFVRSYVIQRGHLFLSLMADAGIYEFEPSP
jgi:para-nitrobenzyl esterase